MAPQGESARASSPSRTLAGSKGSDPPLSGCRSEVSDDTGLDLKIVEFAVQEKIVIFPGALTPTEVMMAWRSGVDFVKVFPCSQLGGALYIQALKAPFPHVPLIASGGVNQQNVADFFLAGATAVGIGAHLIPKKAIELRQPRRIHELAVRLVSTVREARHQRAVR